jgi:hypothetical protein
MAMDYGDDPQGPFGWSVDAVISNVFPDLVDISVCLGVERVVAHSCRSERHTRLFSRI